MPRLRAANRAHTTLNGAINASVTSIVVADASVFSAVPFRAVISAGSTFEIVEVTAIATNTLTVATRGSLAFPDDTAGAAWDSGAVIAQEQTAGYADASGADVLVPVSPGAEQWVVPGYSFNASANAIWTDGSRLEYTPIWVPAEMPDVTDVGVYVVGWPGFGTYVVRMGLYAWNNGNVGTRVADFGTVTMTADATAHSITLGTPLALAPGPYYVAVVDNSSLSITLRSQSLAYSPFTHWATGLGNPVNMGTLFATGQATIATDGLPSSPVTPTGVSLARPVMYMRIK